MTPIERVRRRAEAAALLNVSIYATRDELKQEWKRQAFRAHPDRNNGDERSFRAIQTAFEILLGTAEEDVTVKTAERPSPKPTAGGVRPKRVRSRPQSQTLRPSVLHEG